jgi:hypothetical protein
MVLFLLIVADANDLLMSRLFIPIVYGELPAAGWPHITIDREEHGPFFR